MSTTEILFYDFRDCTIKGTFFRTYYSISYARALVDPVVAWGGGGAVATGQERQGDPSHKNIGATNDIEILV